MGSSPKAGWGRLRNRNSRPSSLPRNTYPAGDRRLEDQAPLPASATFCPLRHNRPRIFPPEARRIHDAALAVTPAGVIKLQCMPKLMGKQLDAGVRARLAIRVREIKRYLYVVHLRLSIAINAGEGLGSSADEIPVFIEWRVARIPKYVDGHAESRINGERRKLVASRTRIGAVSVPLITRLACEAA